MNIRFTLALYNGQLVVLEQRPNLPLIVHTFDSTADALAFYESGSDEPFDQQRRANLAERVKLAGAGAPGGVQ